MPSLSRSAIVIPLKKTFLETEDSIQSVLNEAGNLASGEALKQFDTDGSPIESGGIRWTSTRAIAKDVSNPLWNGRNSTPCLPKSAMAGKLCVRWRWMLASSSPRRRSSLNKSVINTRFWSSVRRRGRLTRESWTRSASIVCTNLGRSRGHYCLAIKLKIGTIKHQSYP